MDISLINISKTDVAIAIKLEISFLLHLYNIWGECWPNLFKKIACATAPRRVVFV